MDVQKEREAFETWYRKNYDNSVIDDSEFSEILDEYESNYYWVDELNQSWKAWQEAKAQAIPEGFVLMPMVPSERMINAVRQCYEGEAYLPYSLYSEFVNQAIIESAISAQEPTND